MQGHRTPSPALDAKSQDWFERTAPLMFWLVLVWRPSACWRAGTRVFAALVVGLQRDVYAAGSSWWRDGLRQA